MEKVYHLQMYNTHHTIRFFFFFFLFVIEKCNNLKYNKCSKLILMKKIKKSLSTRMSARSKTSFYFLTFHVNLKENLKLGAPKKES